jgi:exopolyphosphatase/guanosine-5'-triphosphate,3'-diphosphate pyrophosphatase
MTKFASIDIGSNTLLLLIADDASGELVSVVDECGFGQLGQGLATSSHLHPDAIARSLAIVEQFRARMDEHENLRVACVATQAIREADNRADFVVPAEKLRGTKIEVIDGRREADLVARAVAASFPSLCEQELVVVDVGGASTEFIHIRGGELVFVKSVPIGAVRLRERYLHSDPASSEEIRQLFAGIDDALAALELPQGVPVVGSAGTATTIASLKLQLYSYQPDKVHGLELSPSEVARTLLTLLEAPIEEKKSMRGLEPERAEVISAGVAIYARVLEKLHATSFLVCDRGVRWGVIYELAAHQKAGEPPRPI